MLNAILTLAAGVLVLVAGGGMALGSRGDDEPSPNAESPLPPSPNGTTSVKD